MFKQTALLSEQCAVYKLQQVLEVQSFGLDTGSFVDNTLFEVSPESRCSIVSNRYYCCGNHTAGLSQFKKKLLLHQLRID